jgi:hypothetical protein
MCRETVPPLFQSFEVFVTTQAPAARQSFSAFRHPGYRIQFVSYVLVMMADNVEHVISYWVMYQ